MSELADNAPRTIPRPNTWTAWARTEDWWAIFIGLGLIVIAVAAVAAGADLKWLAVAPQKWHTLPEVAQQLRGHATQYLALFAVWVVLLGIGANALGHRPAQFVPPFALVFVVSLVLYTLGQ